MSPAFKGTEQYLNYTVKTNVTLVSETLASSFGDDTHLLFYPLRVVALFVMGTPGRTPTPGHVGKAYSAEQQKLKRKSRSIDKSSQPGKPAGSGSKSESPHRQTKRAERDAIGVDLDVSLARADAALQAMEAKKQAKKAGKCALVRSSPEQPADTRTASASEKRTREPALGLDAALAAQFEDEYVEDTDADLVPHAGQSDDGTEPTHESEDSDEADTDTDNSEPGSGLRLPRDLDSLATTDQQLLRIMAVEDRADRFEMRMKTEFATLNAKLGTLNQNQLQARDDYDALTKKLDAYTVSTDDFDEMRPKLDKTVALVNRLVHYINGGSELRDALQFGLPSELLAGGASPPPVVLPGPPDPSGLRAMTAKDVLSNLDTFYGNSTKTSEVLDPEEFLPFQLWFDGCVWKLQTVGVPSTEHTRLVCQKLAGAALATFKSKCMAEKWDLSACDMPLLRKRMAALFPNAEAILTRKLNSMTFRVKHLSQDLMTLGHYARHSSFAQMLDQNEFLYTLVRNELHGARANWLIAVQSEYGLSLDKSETFDNYINQAVQIAQKVQASAYADEPSDDADAKRHKNNAGGKSTAAAKADAGAGGAAAAKTGKAAKPNPDKFEVTEKPELRAKQKKMMYDTDPEWQKAVTANNADDADFLRALGACPDCGFLPFGKLSVANHTCHVDKRPQQISLYRSACQMGNGLRKKQ